MRYFIPYLQLPKLSTPIKWRALLWVYLNGNKLHIGARDVFMTGYSKVVWSSHRGSQRSNITPYVMVRSRVISHLTAETISPTRPSYLIQPRFPCTWVIIFYATRWSYLPVDWPIHIRYRPLEVLSRHFVGSKNSYLDFHNVDWSLAPGPPQRHAHNSNRSQSYTRGCVNNLILNNACHRWGSRHPSSDNNVVLTPDPGCGRRQFRRVSRSRSCRNAITMMPDSQIGSDPVRVAVGGSEVHRLPHPRLLYTESSTHLPHRTTWTLC